MRGADTPAYRPCATRQDCEPARRNGGGQTYSDGALASNGGPDNVQRTLIDALLRRLEADLDEVEGVAGDDGTDSTDTAGDEGAHAREGSRLGNFFGGGHGGVNLSGEGESAVLTFCGGGGIDM